MSHYVVPLCVVPLCGDLWFATLDLPLCVVTLICHYDASPDVPLCSATVMPLLMFVPLWCHCMCMCVGEIDVDEEEEVSRDVIGSDIEVAMNMYSVHTK